MKFLPLFIISILLFNACEDNIPEPENPCANELLYFEKSNNSDGSVNFTSNIIDTPLDSLNSVIAANISSINNVSGTHNLSNRTNPAFDKNSGDFVMFFPFAEVWIYYNVNTKNSQVSPIANNFASTEFINGTLYAMEILNATGYTSDSLFFKIHTINPQNGQIISSLNLDKDWLDIRQNGNPNNDFATNLTSSTTNGVDKIYFVSGNNLVTVDVQNETTWINQVYADPMELGYTRLFGLEWLANNSLAVILGREFGGPLDAYYSKIQILSNTSVQLFQQVDLSRSNGFNINYTTMLSTTFDACSNEYYMTWNDYDNNSNLYSKVARIGITTNDFYIQSFNGNLVGGQLIK